MAFQKLEGDLFDAGLLKVEVNIYLQYHQDVTYEKDVGYC